MLLYPSNFYCYLHLDIIQVTFTSSNCGLGSLLTLLETAPHSAQRCSCQVPEKKLGIVACQRARLKLKMDASDWTHLKKKQAFGQINIWAPQELHPSPKI